MCKVQWLANDHPGVNRKPLTEGEYEKLVAAVESVQKSAIQEDLFDEVPVDWQAVADIVGASPAPFFESGIPILTAFQNGRIAVDCFKAYRSGGASKTAPLEWTEAMDKELLEVVQKYGSNDWGAGTPVTLGVPTHHRLTLLLLYCLDNSGKCNVDKCFAESSSGAVRRLITVRQEGALDSRGGRNIGHCDGRCGPAEGTLAAGCEGRPRTERQAVSRSVRRLAASFPPTPSNKTD
jgi:hypothetical protein